MACASLVGDYCCLTESRWKGDSCYLMQMIARSVMRLAVSVGSGVVVEKSWESHWKEMNDRTTRSVLIATGDTELVIGCTDKRPINGA
jgi:hypothetical protein